MSEPRTKEEWLSEVERRSKELETPKDRLVLFAGSDPDPRTPLGKVYASLEARAVVGPNSTGFTTIGATPLGRDLEAAQLYHRQTSGLNGADANAVWSAASREICRQASGNITVLLRANASEKSIFFREELPALLENPRVKSINAVPIEQLQGRPADELRSVLAQNAPRVEFSGEALQERIAREHQRAESARVHPSPPAPPPPPRPKYGP